jgi:RNase P subunit RPR2
MAEFCKQCADELNFPPDFVGISTKRQTEAGLFVSVLCESCGPCQVDHEGRCVSEDCLKEHGK